MAIQYRVKSLLVAILWLGLLAISGCAYFNTFYHAKQFYGQAEKARASERGQPTAQSTSSNYYKQAIQKCEKVIQKYPGSKWQDDAYLLMAQSNYWRGDYLSAQEALTSLLGLKESSLKDQALFWQGRTSLAQENYSDAQSVWQALLKEYPKFKNREEVEYYMAQASWLGGNPDVAVSAYQTLLKRYPNGDHAAPARLDLGNLLVEQKRYDEAEKVFAYVAQKGKLEEDRVEARISLGDVLEKQERYQDALKLYTDLEVSLDATARKNRMSWQARQQLELEEQRRLEQAVEDSLRNASLQEQLALNASGQPGNTAGPLQKDANGNYLDPSGNIIDPSLVDQNGYLIDNGMLPQTVAQNQKPSTTAQNRRTLQRDINDPRQKDLAQVLIREGCVLANLERSDEAITAFQQVVAEYPGSPFAAEAQYRIGYTYEVHKEEFDRAQMAYDAVSRQGNSSFRDDAVRRSKNLVTLKTLMASAAKDSASTAASAAAETRFMRAELYLFQQENVDKAVDEYASIEKEFKGTEHAAKAGLALAWIMEHDRGDSTRAMSKYTEVAEQYPNTEYGRRAHELVYGPEPEPQPGDFQGPSLAELITPENQESAYAQAVGDSAEAGQHLASAGAVPNMNVPGGLNPGVVVAGGALAAGHMAPDETGPPLVVDGPVDSVLYAGPGPADPSSVAGLTSPRPENGLAANTQTGVTPPSPTPTQPSLTSASTPAAGAGATGATGATGASGATGAANTTIAGATGATGAANTTIAGGTNTTIAGATGSAVSGATGAAGGAAGKASTAAAGSLGAMVKATREHEGTVPAVPDTNHAIKDSTNAANVPAITIPANVPGVYLDPLAVPVDGPSPVTKPDSTKAEQKAAPPPNKAKEEPEHKTNEKGASSSSKDSKSSSKSGKNSSKKAEKPSSSGKSDKKGAAPDSTSGKGSP